MPDQNKNPDLAVFTQASKKTIAPERDVKRELEESGIVARDYKKSGPPKGPPKRQLNVTVSPEFFEDFDIYAKNCDESKGDLFEKAWKFYLAHLKISQD